MSTELIRIVDGIARDKNIEREQIYSDIEQAVASGLRKQFNVEDSTEFAVTLDRASGEISVNRSGETVPLAVMGRIGAQTVKQVLIQLIRQDERGSIYEEYKDRVGTIVTGTIARFEGGSMMVTLGRVEGIMPRSEQIPGEMHNPSERIQALILEVRDTPGGVKIILSRSHPELIKRLFEREVPEVGERTIEIKALAREPGHRTKIAVSSIDSRVDAVGACVGVRGSRIKNIVEELGGEKIDIVRWNESSQILIGNALKPAEVAEVALCFELGRATVVVNDDQLSLAIGKRGQNVRLAARLTGWDIDILTPPEFQAGVQRLEKTLTQVEGITKEMVDKVIALGLIDVRDLEEVGTGPLQEELGLDEAKAQQVVDRCTEEAKIVAVEQEAKKTAEAAARRASASASPPAPDAGAETGGDGAAGGFVNPLLAAANVAEPAANESATEAGDFAEGGVAGGVAEVNPDGTIGEVVATAGALQATEGLASEIATHDEKSLKHPGNKTPEEQAMHTVEDANATIELDDPEDRQALTARPDGKKSDKK
jgi:N utilization substance protein A